MGGVGHSDEGLPLLSNIGTLPTISIPYTNHIAAAPTILWVSVEPYMDRAIHLDYIRDTTAD